MNHVLESFHAGEVVCNIGQVDAATKRELDRAVRQGVARKWRGCWFPDPGASWGIGPLKTCWQKISAT